MSQQPGDSQFSESQASDGGGSTLSQVSAGPRILRMLNNISHNSVESAINLLTSLETSIYDGRAAFINTFINLLRQDQQELFTISEGEEEEESVGVQGGVAPQASADGSDLINRIKITIKEEAKEEAAAAKAEAEAEAAKAEAVASSHMRSRSSIFDKMMSADDGKLKHVEFATYIGAKSEPCQVHDRTACAYAFMLREYENHAVAVYTEMKTKGFIDDLGLDRVKALHADFVKRFEAVTSSGVNVGQQTCRDCARDMFNIYKDHYNIYGDNVFDVLPETEVVLTMPYSEYKEIKIAKTEEELYVQNEITVKLQGNDEPRGFDATSSWGRRKVNWRWAYGGADAAIQAADGVYDFYAFQQTVCDFIGISEGEPPKIHSRFTVVERGGDHLQEPDTIPCIPLQFGHKTVECVFNQKLEDSINWAKSGDKSTPLPPYPFLCTYMPEVTLNALSDADVKKQLSEPIDHWTHKHEDFIKKCRSTLQCKIFETATHRPAESQLTPGDIPDKIQHMGITWVLAAVSRGPVSLDATLDKIRLACSDVEQRRAGEANDPDWVVLSDMFLKGSRNNTESECAKYIGFTCGGSAKERGDAGKYWDMFWTQKFLRRPCSFWSGDYLAVAATTAPGLKWGIVVNSTVTVWGIKGQRYRINPRHLRKINAFVSGVHQKVADVALGISAHDFFKSRIQMLLEYLAYIFIRDIISLIRNETTASTQASQSSDHGHVALDTILILCAALGSITTKVDLHIESGTFKPKVEIDQTCYGDIDLALFERYVPSSPLVRPIDASFCEANGIYDTESYFRKIIPLASLDAALNKHSGSLWAYDYISEYTGRGKVRTTDLKDIYDLHTKRRGVREDECLENLERTFASVDVLCIAKMIRSTRQSSRMDEGYNKWLKSLCDTKLQEFLKSNKNCETIFRKLVQFTPPANLGRRNRLHDYLQGHLFPAHAFCKPVMAQQVEDNSSQSSFSSSPPQQYSKQQLGFRTCEQPNDQKPEQFMADLVYEVKCREKEKASSSPPLKQRATSSTSPGLNETTSRASDIERRCLTWDEGDAALLSPQSKSMEGESTSELYRFLAFLENKQKLSGDRFSSLFHLFSTLIFTVRAYIAASKRSHMVIALDAPQAAEVIIDTVRDNEVDSTLYQHLAREISEFLGSTSRGGSSTRRRRRRSNHRRTQYTNKHKRSSSKTAKRATIKRGKSYHKHKHTVKRRTNRK